MHVHHLIAALAIAGSTIAAPSLAAQIDYRNLDEGRPIRTEDAYPVERDAFELVLPYTYENERGADRVHLTAPELAWGALPNTMVGVKLPFGAVDPGFGTTDWGFAGPQLFGFYNFNTEAPWLPALALRTDVSLPLGDLAGDDVRAGLTGVATRSWGRARAHVNVTAGIGPDPDAGATLHPIPDWSGSIALDRSFLRRSLLVAVELAAEWPDAGASPEVTAAVGARFQLTPTMVVDAGVERRLGDSGPDLGLTLGASYAFGLARRSPGRRAVQEDPSVRADAVPSLEQRDEQFYRPGAFNWVFLRTYPEAARLFNAFDYGHAVLYERLLGAAAGEPAALEREYRFLTRDLLVRPPRFAIAEEAVMPDYAKLAWQAKQMFDWAHVLHRQIYDVYADERLTLTAKDSLIERLTDHYLARADLAFVPVPKSMALMDEQSFSQVFRREHARFNGLIWAYHWLQVGLYEPLIAGRTTPERKQLVQATVARFWEMVQREEYPAAMPMTSAIAPEFSRRHPRAAVIFDNLHMMHDIISDVLASPDVPRDRKRTVIYTQLAEFRDPSTNVISLREWRSMAEYMGGVAAMGGPALDLLRTPDPAPAGNPAGHHHHE